MQVDTSGLDMATLLSLLNDEYLLDVDSLAFVPKGEEAYHYVATERSGRRWFVKAQDHRRAAGLVTGLETAAVLSGLAGLDRVLVAQRTKDGRLSLEIDHYRVAVFPFLDGASGHEERFADEELGAAARLVAAVHGSTERIGTATLPRVTFADQFGPPILRSLQAASDLGPATNGYRARVRDLLLDEQADVLAELAAVRRLAEQAAALTTNPVLTHGDPNYANLVRGAGGRIYLVDWSEPALGPRERDLFAFAEDRFELSLRHYLDVSGQVRLHAPIFAYYAHLWVVQEIADYTTRILFTNTDRAEDGHAWERLTPYLPIPHSRLHADIEAIQDTLRRFS